MKKINMILALIFATQTAFAGVITDDNLDLGKPSSTGTKSLTFKGPTKKKLSSTSTGVLSYDGNTNSLGDGLNTSNKLFEFNNGTANKPFWKYDFATDEMQSGNSSSAALLQNTVKIGDGTNSNKVLKFNKGALSPEIRFNSTTGKLQFTNDTTTYKDIGSGSGGGGGTNLLQEFNSDFEAGSPPQNWTSSGGTFVTETASPLFGLQSGSWDSSASAQTLSSQLVVIEKGFIGKKCTADIEYKWPLGVSGDLSFQVVDQVPNILATVSLEPTVNSNTRKAFLAFDCPSVATDQLRVRLLSNVVNPALILIDNAFVGVNKSTTQISQTQLVVSAKYAAVVSCDPAVTNTSFSSAATIAACPAITVISSTIPVTTADTDLVNLVLPNVPVGRYLLRVTGTHQGSAANQFISHRVGDGTNWGPPVGRRGATTIDASTFTATFEFDQTASGPKTFSIQAAADSGTAYFRNSLTNGIASETHFELVKYPTTSGEALNLETTGWKVEATIQGSNPSLSLVTVAGRTAISDAAWTMTLAQGSSPALVPCSGNNPATGLTCSAGNEVLGVVVDIPYAGDYYLCGATSTEFSMPNGGRLFTNFAWTETDLTGATQVRTFPSNGQTQGSNVGTGSQLYSGPVRQCNIVNFTSAGRKRFQLEYQQSVSGSLTSHIVLADGSATNGNRNIQIQMFPITQAFPAPVFTELQNLLKSVSFSAAHTAGQSIANGGTSTPVIMNLENFDSANVHNPTTGIFTAPIAGKYSCLCQVGYASIATPGNSTLTASLRKNGTSFEIETWTTTAGVGNIYTPMTAAIISLNALETLECMTFQNTGAARSLSNNAYLSQFSCSRTGN